MQFPPGIETLNLVSLLAEVDFFFSFFTQFVAAVQGLVVASCIAVLCARAADLMMIFIERQ